MVSYLLAMEKIEMTEDQKARLIDGLSDINVLTEAFGEALREFEPDQQEELLKQLEEGKFGNFVDFIRGLRTAGPEAAKKIAHSGRLANIDKKIQSNN